MPGNGNSNIDIQGFLGQCDLHIINLGCFTSQVGGGGGSLSELNSMGPSIGDVTHQRKCYRGGATYNNIWTGDVN